MLSHHRALPLSSKVHLVNAFFVNESWLLTKPISGLDILVVGDRLIIFKHLTDRVIHVVTSALWRLRQEGEEFSVIWLG